MAVQVISGKNPIANAALIDRINTANDIHVVTLMREYDAARQAKDDAEATMKGLKDQLTLGLGAIADIVELDKDAYAVEIHYPGPDGTLEKWRLGLQTNHYEKLSKEELLAQGVTPEQIKLATNHSNSSFTTVKRLK